MKCNEVNIEKWIENNSHTARKTQGVTVHRAQTAASITVIALSESHSALGIHPEK